MADLFQPLPFFNSTLYEDDFLRVELSTGLMFSKFALRARYRERRDRNCANARRAYDALRYFRQKKPDGIFARSGEMTRGMARLKSELQQLGEEV